MQLDIRDDIELSRVKRTGRPIGTGTSKEYEIGTKIHEKLNVGDSVWFNCLEVDRASLIVRLNRINEKNNSTKRFTSRAEFKEWKTPIFSNYKIGYIEYQDHSIEGFRIHRIK